MNNFEKEYAKHERRNNSKLHKWWCKNKHKILRVVLFWIYIPMLCYEKLKDRQYKALKYDDNVTKKYLDKLLPKIVVRKGVDPARILITNTDDYDSVRFYWDFDSAWMRRKHKNAARYLSKFSKRVETYIMDTYQIDGYKKMVFNNFNDWKAAKDIFGWEYVPWNYENSHGALFYEEE